MSLKLKDLLLLTAVILMVGLLFFFSFQLPAIALLLFFIVLILFIHYRRQQRQIKNGFLDLKKYQETLYQQTEAMASLTKVLPLVAPLPPMRHFAISPDLAKLLVTEILERKPKTIVETGSGVSTLVMGYALKKIGQGKIISLENNEDYVHQNQKLLEQHHLEKFVRLDHAPLVPIQIKGKEWLWYQFKRLGKIDLLLIDGPLAKTQSLARYPALPLLYPSLKPNALIVIDDMIREDEQQMVAQWLEEFPDLERLDLCTEKGATLLRKVPKNRQNA